MGRIFRLPGTAAPQRSSRGRHLLHSPQVARFFDPGGFLHLGKKALPYLHRLKFWLQALQTSSPSYLVMLSLDLARRQAALKGRLFTGAWRWAGACGRS